MNPSFRLHSRQNLPGLCRIELFLNLISRQIPANLKVGVLRFMLALAPLGMSPQPTLGQDSETDRFGIQKIYADAPQPSNSWTFTGDANDPRFMEQRIIPADDGWFRPEDPK